MDELMKELGVESIEELVSYVNDPAHQDEPIVKELIVLLGIAL